MCTHCKGTMMCSRLNCSQKCTLGRCSQCYGYTGIKRLTPRATRELEELQEFQRRKEEGN